MPDGVQVMPVQLPGRERRLRERPYDTMVPLVRDLFTACRSMLDTPWAIFGHSMGAGIAWEIAMAGAEAGVPPRHLFVSARRAPGTPMVHPPLFALPKDQLIQEVERLYGPLPRAMKTHPSLMKNALPTMRADFRLLDTWTPTMGVLDEVPITAFGGDQDSAVPLPSLQPWADRTTGSLQTMVMSGGHFFVRESSATRERVADLLTPYVP
jgi:surfactin synthase thioesterase subunit